MEEPKKIDVFDAFTDKPFDLDKYLGDDDGDDEDYYDEDDDYYYDYDDEDDTLWY